MKITMSVDPKSFKYRHCPYCHKVAKVTDVIISRDDGFDKFFAYVQHECECGCRFATSHEYKLESVGTYNVTY